MKRAFRVEHHPQAHGHHSRRGQRHEMARDDHPGIAEGTAIVIGRPALEQRDAMAFARGVVCGAKPDHPAADDENGFGLHGSGEGIPD